MLKSRKEQESRSPMPRQMSQPKFRQVELHSRFTRTPHRRASISFFRSSSHRHFKRNSMSFVISRILSQPSVYNIVDNRPCQGGGRIFNIQPINPCQGNSTDSRFGLGRLSVNLFSSSYHFDLRHFIPYLITLYSSITI
jgi:hypothetical protein